MYAVITPYSRNFLDTQDFDIISRHRDITRAAARCDFRSQRIVEMDGWRAVRTIADVADEPGYTPQDR